MYSLFLYVHTLGDDITHFADEKMWQILPSFVTIGLCLNSEMELGGKDAICGIEEKSKLFMEKDRGSRQLNFHSFFLYVLEEKFLGCSNREILGG